MNHQKNQYAIKTYLPDYVLNKQLVNIKPKTVTQINTDTTCIEVNKLERMAFILKTVAHPIRLGVVKVLDKYEKLSVGEICDKLGTEQSLTSHHLASMKLKGMLKAQREGKSVYYMIKETEITKIFSCLERCSCNMG